MDLISRLKRGEPAAVREWFTRDHDDLLKFVSLKISDLKDAEEIVQETFINCLKQLSLFRGEAKLSTWMKSIARHEIADYYRKKYAKKALRTVPLGELVLGVKMSNASETSQKVAQVLENMSHHYKELLLLKYVDKKHIKHMSRELNKSVKSIESDLFRARKEFRELYVTI